MSDLLYSLSALRDLYSSLQAQMCSTFTYTQVAQASGSTSHGQASLNDMHTPVYKSSRAKHTVRVAITGLSSAQLLTFSHLKVLVCNTSRARKPALTRTCLSNTVSHSRSEVSSSYLCLQFPIAIMYVPSKFVLQGNSSISLSIRVDHTSTPNTNPPNTTSSSASASSPPSN